MYAIVNIAGQQFKVQENKPVYVHRIDANEGDALKFDQVLLVDNNGSVTVGAPLISGAAVTAKVISHLKGDKVIVFKKKRRQNYRRKNGHRQNLTVLKITEIKG